MTRAIDRLIVSGSIDPDAARRERRRSAGCSSGSTRRDSTRSARSRPGRDRARRRTARSPGRPPRARARPSWTAPGRTEAAALALRCGCRTAPVPAEAPELLPLEPVAAPPLHGPPALVHRALALRPVLVQVLRRYVAGLRERRHAVRAQRAGLAATAIGSAVHAAARADRPRAPAAVRTSTSRRAVPGGDRRGARAHPRLRRGVLRRPRSRARILALEGAAPEQPFAFEHDGVVLHGFIDVLHRAGARARRRLQDERARRGRRPRRSSRPSTGSSGSSMRSRASAPVRSEVEVVYQFLERPDELVVDDVSRVDRCARSRAGAVGGDRAHPGGRVRADAERVAAPTARRSTSSAPGPRLRSASLMAAVATSREARRRVGPKRARIGPVIERLARGASGRGDRAPLPQRARAARRRDALGPDDRRERQPRHRATCSEKYRTPEDYLAVPEEELQRDIYADRLLPAEGEGAPRHDAACCSRSTTAGCRGDLDELVRLPGVARKTANVVAPSCGDPQGSSSTRTSAGCRSGSASRGTTTR